MAAEDTVVVPPGHEVVVRKASAEPCVDLASSGVLILDYGRSGDWRLMNSRLEALLKQREAAVVVILQNTMIDRLDYLKETGDFFAYWKKAKERDIGAVWVLPLEASKRAPIVGSIREVGYSAHGSAPDGACFVEVHKPDGSIIVGMPGAAL